ncbi:Guanylyl cyclase [Anopheles sinensis]|uniref:Guanylyl cyclase n=1 Tax=Anopheles sinensis TaxID=74873 RepID=A0A084VTE3_ANOSI|nr:Guanylyl cyclase [Anopheles sinensis]
MRNRTSNKPNPAGRVEETANTARSERRPRSPLLMLLVFFQQQQQGELGFRSKYPQRSPSSKTSEGGQKDSPENRRSPCFLPLENSTPGELKVPIPPTCRWRIDQRPGTPNKNLHKDDARPLLEGGWNGSENDFGNSFRLVLDRLFSLELHSWNAPSKMVLGGKGDEPAR